VTAAYCSTPNSVVGLSVCMLVAFLSSAKTAEPIEMPFEELTRVGQKNHVCEGSKLDESIHRHEGCQECSTALWSKFLDHLLSLSAQPSADRNAC